MRVISFSAVYIHSSRDERSAQVVIFKKVTQSLCCYFLYPLLSARGSSVYTIFWCCVHVKRERRRRCVCVFEIYSLSLSLLRRIYSHRGKYVKDPPCFVFQQPAAETPTHTSILAVISPIHVRPFFVYIYTIDIKNFLCYIAYQSSDK
jgi:hypothetical protein